jgi:hypothetical protein
MTVLVGHLPTKERQRRRNHAAETGDKDRAAVGRIRHLFGKLLRQPLVVIVEKSDPFAIRMMHACVASGGRRQRARINADAQARTIDIRFRVGSINADNDFKFPARSDGEQRQWGVDLEIRLFEPQESWRVAFTRTSGAVRFRSAGLTLAF